ncbi:UDP-D-xylose:L-fucose alpha-1,3-D-xylosyltransferase MGP4-like isoform X1 [Phalaenopsis equestris]|uniref:UDP-D-xylose:L-fucose alpha-1,3-D-xylosyltransferase MGP4-like isoform X1 n=1 Tax=Phalaenopsis equestris TaxID=78828 RepID=UPI0009E38A71|nr:UDP-D-xylose:L-fucose alpha-1,3-D-xylosyltransferase MGP4-like isoform X1 [Phalaenopsis equestris]
MYNDVDMVWLSDPFPYLEGHLDIYFTNDMIVPLNHSHGLPQPGKKGRTYICSCMIFLRPTDRAKAVLMKWIEELRLQPWSNKSRSNDQPAFNWPLNNTSFQVRSELPSTYKVYRYQQHRWACGPANLFRKMASEIMAAKVCFFRLNTKGT